MEKQRTSNRINLTADLFTCTKFLSFECVWGLGCDRKREGGEGGRQEGGIITGVYIKLAKKCWHPSAVHARLNPKPSTVPQP